ncbi:hypothetical protein N9A51_01385 [Pseudomonadales bacterium]|nr:hypothetical protein [Pseudomonadales bacterium]
MKNKGFVWQHGKTELTQDENILHKHFYRNKTIARHAIWRYVEADIPIPNELKPILLEILKEDYVGKAAKETAAYWLILVKAVAFTIVQEGLTRDVAIEKIAKQYDQHFDTLERRYRDGKYSKIKKSILSI